MSVAQQGKTGSVDLQGALAPSDRHGHTAVMAPLAGSPDLGGSSRESRYLWEIFQYSNHCGYYTKRVSGDVAIPSPP